MYSLGITFENDFNLINGSTNDATEVINKYALFQLKKVSFLNSNSYATRKHN